MNGMVDSFNVSVAAGILMHHAVCDRTSRLVRWQCLVLLNRLTGLQGHVGTVVASLLFFKHLVVQLTCLLDLHHLLSA